MKNIEEALSFFDALSEKQMLHFCKLAKYFPDPHAEWEAIILRYQLITETMIKKLLNEILEKPEALKQANLSSFQSICLLEAIVRPPRPSWIWIALKKLNKIRNQAAHNLVVKGLEDQVHDFNTYVRDNHWGEKNDFPDYKDGFQCEVMLLLLYLLEMSVTESNLLHLVNDRISESEKKTAPVDAPKTRKVTKE